MENERNNNNNNLFKMKERKSVDSCEDMTNS